MSARLEVPDLDDLRGLGIAIEPAEQDGVVSLIARANDGSSVKVTWDEIAGSISVRWLEGDDERLVLERETVSRISVRAEAGSVHFRVWSRSEGLRGELAISVGELVSVNDVLLRT